MIDVLLCRRNFAVEIIAGTDDQDSVLSSVERLKNVWREPG